METAPLMLALVALAGSPAAAGNTGELKIGPKTLPSQGSRNYTMIAWVPPPRDKNQCLQAHESMHRKPPVHANQAGMDR